MNDYVDGKSHRKNKEIVLNFLKDHKMAVVATASRQGDPQVAVLYYAIDDDFTFSFMTNNKSRKWENLKENPHIALVVGTGPDLITIQCGGHVEIVDRSKDFDRSEKIIRRVIENSKLHGAPPALPVLMDPAVELGTFIFKPEWMVFLNLEIRKNGEKYPNEYIKILP